MAAKYFLNDRGRMVRVGSVSPRLDREIIPGHVDGLANANSNAALRSAAAAAAAAMGSASAGRPDLPLAYVTASPHGQTTAWVNGTYMRTPVSVPSLSADVLASTRTGVSHLRYYQQPNILDGNNRPDGGLVGLRFANNVPFAQQLPWRVDTEIIRVSTVLASDPRSTVRPYIGTVNTSAIALKDIVTAGAGSGGETYDAHTLWLRGAQVTPFEKSCGTKVYLVDYELEWTASPGWVQQMLVSLIAPTTNDQIVSAVSPTGFGTILILNYVFSRDLVSFTGILPTHTPAACS